MKNFLSVLLIGIGTLVFNVQAKEHDKTLWNVLSDPKDLITYCDGQFVKNSNKPTCTISPNSADEAKVFSKALWEIWSGRTKLARAKLNKLHNNKKWSLWGGIGLFELAYQTGNQKQLGSLLKLLKKDFFSSENTLFINLYNYYELMYAGGNHEWKRLESLLGKYSKEIILYDPVLFSLQSRIFYIKKQESELAKLINKASPTVKKTSYYVPSVSYYTFLKFGIKESNAILRRYATDRPEDMVLTVSYLHQQLLDKNPNVAKNALNKLLEIIRSSKNNINLIFQTVLTLIQNKKYNESVNVLKMANFNNDVVLDDFVSYHIYLAWHDVYMGKDDAALNKLEEALSMAPRNIDVHDLKFLLERKHERPELALNSLKVLLESDPHNNNYRNEFSVFRKIYKLPELKSLYQRMNTYH